MWSAKIVHDWASDFVKVWIYKKISLTTMSIFYPSAEGCPRGGSEWMHQTSMPLPDKPSFELPLDVLKALIDAGSEEFPPSTVLHTHLKDAISIRDRLLSILEKRPW